MTVSPKGSFNSLELDPHDPSCPSVSSANENDTQIGAKEDVAVAAVVNAKIEAQLRRDSEKFRREESGALKILLLGQAGSGKSTTLKVFRMKYAREEWEQERLGWRAIIQLNIVRQVLAIVQIIVSELGGRNSAAEARSENGRAVVDALQTWITGSTNPTGAPTRPAPPSHQTNSATQRPRFTEQHRRVITRLSPRLDEVEQELKSRLGPHEVYYSAMTTPVLCATPFEPGEEIDDDMLFRKTIVEYSFRSWRDVLDAAPKPPISSSSATLTTIACGTDSKSVSLTLDYIDMPTRVIADMREDIKTLWTDGDVRTLVKLRRLEIPDSIGFDSDGESPFLDDIDRLARTDYEVNDDDIVRARLKTVGIQEYKFNFESGAPIIVRGKKWSWNVYDVGGCRTMRNAWLPYFDKVQVIIFLAPVSVFDERLEEDPRVNRLEDSIVLWSCICETPLLASTQLVLFLNKCDLLQKKLDRGVRVVDHLSSYGKRANDAKHVIRYVREKFKTIHQEKSPTNRTFSSFPTTVTDTQTTAVTLETVRDNVIRRHLANTQFM